MESVHPDDVAFKVRTWLENLETETHHDVIRTFEERTVNIGGSRSAENHCEQAMARC